MTETGTTGATGRKGPLDQLETLTAVIACVALVGVVAVQAWQVFARYVLNASPSWTEPLALILVATAAMFGAAIGARKETHFNFPTIADAMPGPIKALCRILARLALFTTGAGLAVYGAMLAADSMAVQMAGVAIPVGLRFVPVALGGALIALFSLERLISRPALAPAPMPGEGS